jgi:gliding motility-associated-like protein
MEQNVHHSWTAAIMKNCRSQWLGTFVFLGLVLNPGMSQANECNGVSLDVQVRDCYCITFRANHNGHCYCSVYWDFGNGNTPIDNGCDISKTECYAGPGTYTVSVYVDCPGGDCSTSLTIVIPPENITSEFTHDSVCAGFCNQFTDQSSGDYQYWLWDFDDGFTSSQQNPCHTFPTDGVYNVSLQITDSNGCDDIITHAVQVFQNPIADAGGYNKICGGDLTTIGGNPTVSGGAGPWTYQWSPGTNLNCTNCPNPVATPLVTTSYSITITDVNGCIDSSSILIQVNPNPTAIFSVDTPCLGFPNNFIDQSLGLNTQWYWSFGDGGIDTAQSPSHLYTADGSYLASLLVTTDSGCTDTISQVVVVDPNPQVDFNVSNICLYDSAYFLDNTIINSPGVLASWLWDLGDGNGSVQQNPVHLYATEGNYTITLIVTSTDGCIDTASQQLIIHPIPEANFTKQNVCEYDTAFFVDASTLSAGNIVGWDWDLGDGNSTNVQNPNNDYASHGQYQVQLIITTDSGCVDSITRQITIHPKPTAAFTVDDICVYEPAVFSDSSVVPSPGVIVSWNYDFGDNTIPSTLQNPSHDYTTYDTLIITQIVATDSGCLDTAWEELIIHPQPQTWFVTDTTKGCEYLPVQFSDSTTIPGGYTITGWSWDLGDNTSSTEQHPDNVYSSIDLWTPGLFTITLVTTSSVGCVDTLVQLNMIEAWPVPIADFTDDPNPATILFPYITFDNLSEGGSFYYWDMGDGFTYQTGSDSNYTHNYSNIDTGIYIVELITENIYGCLDTAYDSVNVRGDYILFVPNTFTPNNDGLNDLFFPQGIGFRDLASLEFLIFDRWGDLIFKSENINDKWDGRANGGRFKAQQDVYVWLILAADYKGVKHKYVGHVTLIR